VSRFDLRDISERLSRSADAEAVVYEFLGALQEAHPDWKATIAFYEVSRDALVKLYERDGLRLRSREISVLVDQLPARMIRNFFHPNSFFEPAGRKSILGSMPAPVQTSPAFHPDLSDAVLLRQLLPVANWMSCVCLPIADRDEVLAVLVVVSEKRGAFEGKGLDEVLPLKSMATMALSQRLRRAVREEGGSDSAARASAEFKEQVEQLSLHARELEEDNRNKAQRLAELLKKLEQVDQNGTQHRSELDRVKQTITELEQQTHSASTDLGEASAQLDKARTRIDDLRVTTDLIKDLFQLLAEPHDPRQFPKTVLEWVSEFLAVDRCSVMLIDRNGHHLRIALQVGIPAEIAERVRVRIGQGVAGWVALNNKPLFVRMRDERPDLERPNRTDYNTDSFVCVPVTFNGRVTGVLNLSNKASGQPFDDIDLERAVLIAGVLAITLGANEVVRRALAWAA
jgi:transcriptional regulator with GAF, ATPase, and Fis domain